MAAKIREFAQKTHGKYELIHIRSGWANVLGRHDAATSEGEPLPVALASVYLALLSSTQHTFQHCARMGPASELLPEALCAARAPLARLHSPSFQPLPPSAPHRTLIQGIVSFFGGQRRRAGRRFSTRSSASWSSPSTPSTRSSTTRRPTAEGRAGRRVAAGGLRRVACGSVAIAACTFDHARLFGRLRTPVLVYFRAPNVSRAHVLILFTVRVWVSRGRARAWGDDGIFASRDVYHDICLGGCMWISTNHFLIRATVRPRRREQMKEILSRISWYGLP